MEEVRRYLEKKYGTADVHEGRLSVYTTLDLDLQRAATRAVLDGLAAYEHRHGWVGICPMLSPPAATWSDTTTLTGES